MYLQPLVAVITLISLCSTVGSFSWGRHISAVPCLRRPDGRLSSRGGGTFRMITTTTRDRRLESTSAAEALSSSPPPPKQSPLLQQLSAFLAPVATWAATFGLVSTLLFVPSMAVLRPDNAQAASFDGSVTSTTTLAPVVKASSSSTSSSTLMVADEAADAVQQVIQALREAHGDAQATYRAYERINDMITTGEGVGGQVNIQGVPLQRGYVSDEDTTIYNPGLFLLTESEKEQLVDAVIQARRAGLSATTPGGEWSRDNQLGYEFLKEKLDPFHIVELRGYLGTIPVLTAVLYLAVLAVQQLAPRPWFPIAYFVGVAVLVLPALILVAAGP